MRRVLKCFMPDAIIRRAKTAAAVVKTITVLIVGSLSVSVPNIFASYQMFCELEGTILTDPIELQGIEFGFRIDSARNLEMEDLIDGEPGCHLLEGQSITVNLDREDAGERRELVKGTVVVLERYEMDAISSTTGDIVRSIKYVRQDR